MENEIEFKKDFELESEVKKTEDVDLEKDLGIEEIEELPDIETKDQFIVTQAVKKEQTREKLAIVFIIGFFFVLSLSVAIGTILDESKAKNVIDMILAFSGIFGTPLGFIMGYYFKKKEEE